jgi:hypothetical protein
MTNEEQPPAPEEQQAPMPTDEESVAGSLMEGLTPTQVKGIMALLSEPTITRAANGPFGDGWKTRRSNAPTTRPSGTRSTKPSALRSVTPP